MVTRETHPHLFPTVEQDIERNLIEIEMKYDVKILTAVALGSRAWGFADAKSDWDIRFVYVPKIATYTSMIKHPEVLDKNTAGWMVNDDRLDFSGWEVRKALSLASKSNSQAHEIFHSPLVFIDHPDLTDKIRALIRSNFRAGPSYHHYRGIAANELQKEKMAPKGALHALRCILSAFYVARMRSIPPMSVSQLVTEVSRMNFAELRKFDIPSLYECLVLFKTHGLTEDEPIISLEPDYSDLPKMFEMTKGLMDDDGREPDIQAFDSLLQELIRNLQ